MIHPCSDLFGIGFIIVDRYEVRVEGVLNSACGTFIEGGPTDGVTIFLFTF